MLFLCYLTILLILSIIYIYIYIRCYLTQKQYTVFNIIFIIGIYESTILSVCIISYFILCKYTSQLDRKVLLLVTAV